MKVRKKINYTGREVILFFEEIKRYKYFTRYQVYKFNRGEWEPIYKTSLTWLDIKKIILNDNVIEEEVFS